MRDKSLYEKADLKKVEEYAHELAARIKASGFKPALVVGIESGGHLIGKIVANELYTDFETVRVRRKSSKLTHSNAMRRIIGTKRSRIRGLLLNFFFPLMNPRVENASIGRLDSKYRVLIVDDGVQTGKTMEVVKQILVRKGAKPENIKTAAVNVIGKKYRPDFFLTTKRIYWPWSATSPEYKAFRRWQTRERRLRQRQKHEKKLMHTPELRRVRV
jgi:hypoxanthine phosphoribosyltransferase